jgi:hypothetical protein
MTDLKLTALACLLFSGCAALEPTAISVGVAHESHATQHRPLTSNPTDYGYAVVPEIGVRWEHGPVRAEVSEGYSLQGNNGSPAPKEIFEGRVTIDVWHK